MKPAELEERALRAVTPRCRYQDGEDFAAWQKAARARLHELLGLDRFEAVDPEPEMEYEHKKDGYTETRFRFRSETDFTVPCHMLTPDAPARGVMICLQGHSTGMYNSLGEHRLPDDEESQKQNDRAFARIALERGFIAVALEQRCFGEQGGTPYPDCAHTALTALLRGRTLIGERVWDVKNLVAVLRGGLAPAGLPVYVMGNSGGGTATFYAAAALPELDGAMPSCSVCTYADSIVFRRHCTCNYVPRIAEFFDMGDLAGLIAPRPYVQVNGRDDEIFLVNGAEESFREAQRLYAAAGAPDRCRLVIGDGGHRFYADPAYAALDDLLRTETQS